MFHCLMSLMQYLLTISSRGKAELLLKLEKEEDLWEARIAPDTRPDQGFLPPSILPPPEVRTNTLDRNTFLSAWS